MAGVCRLAVAAVVLVVGVSVTGFQLPIVRRGRVVVRVEFAGGILADIQQVQVGGAGGYYSRKCNGRDPRPVSQKLGSRLHQNLRGEA